MRLRLCGLVVYLLARILRNFPCFHSSFFDQVFYSILKKPITRNAANKTSKVSNFNVASQGTTVKLLINSASYLRELDIPSKGAPGPPCKNNKIGLVWSVPLINIHCFFCRSDLSVTRLLFRETLTH
jgi:hypothetical protein